MDIVIGEAFLVLLFFYRGQVLKEKLLLQELILPVKNRPHFRRALFHTKNRKSLKLLPLVNM